MLDIFKKVTMPVLVAFTGALPAMAGDIEVTGLDGFKWSGLTTIPECIEDVVVSFSVDLDGQEPLFYVPYARSDEKDEIGLYDTIANTPIRLSVSVKFQSAAVDRNPNLVVVRSIELNYMGEYQEDDQNILNDKWPRHKAIIAYAPTDFFITEEGQRAEVTFMNGQLASETIDGGVEYNAESAAMVIRDKIEDCFPAYTG